MSSIDLANLDLLVRDLNYLAIVVGVIINQAIGAAWYGALGMPWMAEVGLTQEDMEAMKGTPRQWYPYVIAAGSALIFTFALAFLIGAVGAEGILEGLFFGVMAAACFILTAYATTYSFENRSLRLFLINSGYPLISYAIIGVLLGVWQ